MTQVTPLAFNIAMKTLSTNQIYDRDDAELAAMAQQPSTLNDAGIDAARVLEAAVRQNANRLDFSSDDEVGGWLYAALGYAMFGDLPKAQAAVGAISPAALASAPTYGMVGCLCSPRHIDAIVQADPRVSEVGRNWNLALTATTHEQREEALEKALALMIAAGLAGCMMEGSMILHAQTAAWQIYRLTTSQST